MRLLHVTLLLLPFLLLIIGCASKPPPRASHPSHVSLVPQAYAVEIRRLTSDPAGVADAMYQKVRETVVGRAYFVPKKGEGEPEEVGSAELEASRLPADKVARFYPTLEEARHAAKRLHVGVGKVVVILEPPLNDGRFNVTLSVLVEGSNGKWRSIGKSGNFRFPDDEEMRRGIIAKPAEEYLPEIRDLIITLALK